MVLDARKRAFYARSVLANSKAFTVPFVSDNLTKSIADEATLVVSEVCRHKILSATYDENIRFPAVLIPW